MDRPSIEEFIAQARSYQESQPGGRSPLPSFTSWPTWPFEGEIVPRAFTDAVLPEVPRKGENGADCRACRTPDEEYLWTDALWRVRSTGEPTGLPAVLFLEPRAHHDLDSLSDDLIDGLGRMMRRVERALLSLGDVARVQMARWGDGAEHFHLWFFPRPRGFAQGRGSFLPLWDDLLPPRPEVEWGQTLRELGQALAATDR